MKPLLFINCLIFLHSSIFAQSTTKLLEGTIQNYPIVMEFSVNDDSTCYGRYFYATEKKDIELEGKMNKDGSLQLHTSGWGSTDTNYIAEKFDLKPVPNSYAGNWMNRTKKFPVALKEVSIEHYKNPFDSYSFVQNLKKDDPYSYLRTSALEFIKDSTTHQNVCTFDWYHEKYSGITLFRVSKGFEAAALKKINNQLTETQLSQINAFLECSSPFGRGEFDQYVQHIFANLDVLSVNIFTSYDCGGAHPDFGSQALNFDAHTGALLELDDLFWFGKTHPPTKDSREWDVYRETIAARKIVELLSRLYPQNMRKPASEDDCDYSDASVWKFPNWYFTPKGLYVGAIFARALRPCDESEWAIIPYSNLKPYKNPNSTTKLPE